MKTMQTCNYAVVRFLPYRETGEFVNVGVVLFCRDAGFFDVALETQKRRRVTDFFPELDKELFSTGRQTFNQELRRIKQLLCADDRKLADEARLTIFRELVRPRESVFRFSEIGTVLAEDPAKKLAELFNRFVNRQFAKTKEYQETVMAHRLTEVLRAHDLIRHYRTNQKVGNDDFHVLMPIVSEARNDRGVALRAIKPLDLDRDEPTKIYDHGDAWIKRVERLRQVNQLPEGMLFTLREAVTDDKRIKACQQIREELTRLEVRVLTNGDENGVLEFAKLEGN
jgi:hypothetical protein